MLMHRGGKKERNINNLNYNTDMIDKNNLISKIEINNR